MAQAVAQAQAQAQHTITHTESLELVRCLLRVSVFHVTAMRGLFPEKYYKEVPMKNLGGMEIKMLTPRDDESKRLVDWVEGGVYDAVKHGYLKTLLFGISSNAEGTDLLEEYVFNFEYGKDGVLEMLNLKPVCAKAPEELGGKIVIAPKATVSGVRYQVTRMLRMLVQLCRTLDPVPKERFLFCRLVYHDHCPDDYEPQFFRSLNLSDQLGHFSRRPFSMHVGNVATEHHQVSLKIKSVLEATDDVGEGDTDMEEQASDQLVTEETHGGQEVQSEVVAQGGQEDEGEGMGQGGQEDEGKGMGQGGQEDEGEGAGMGQDGQEGEGEAQGEAQGEVQDEGQGQGQGGKGKAEGQKAIFSAGNGVDGTELATHMDGLCVGGGVKVHSAPAASSCQAAIQSNGGSDMTMPPTGCSQGHQHEIQGQRGGGDDIAVAPPSQPVPTAFIDGSQQSGQGAAKKRKMSFVSDPIHQVGKTAKKGKTAKPTPVSRRTRMSMMRG
ncbi:hypothetical protein FOA52_005991 [Chlamydomonas sp. UWO 241]|nr:hypothetical protein FOA52_005991 [Chlamydomonas sp. UWO 241]